MISRICPAPVADLAGRPASAATIQGVSFPEHFPINGQTLVLNGVGLRTVTIFRVKIYVAGLYLPRQSHSQQDILAMRGNKVIVVMRFIHAGSKADVERQYRKGEQENCGNGECDPADAPDFEKLIAAAPAVEPGDTFTYVITDTGLQLYFNNKLVIEIANKDLGYRILAGFIGDHPPSRSCGRRCWGCRPAEPVGAARAAGLRQGGAVRNPASKAPPPPSSSTITAMPARWLCVIAVTAPRAAGPTKPVTRPESANRPNCALRCSAGAMRAIRLRLAAWAGPTKTPRPIASSQNVPTWRMNRIARRGSTAPSRAISTVGFGPIQSSTKAKTAAPIPPVRLSRMPSSRTDFVSMPNWPAA